MYWLKLNKKKIASILLLLILVIPAIYPLLNIGFPLTDDGNWMVIRFSAFYESLRSGQFPVRFLMRLNNGFGYPVSDFLYPLFMYIGVPIHILGISFVNTIKIIFIFCLISSSLFSFFWLRKLFDNISSLVGSLIYVYLPYHLFDIYKRGSVGEALSLSILPFILWQIERGSLVLSSIGVSFLILSHNSLAVLFLGMIILYMGLNIYVSKQRKQLTYKNLSILIFGFGISAFFWIPAILDLQYTVFNQTKISDFNSYFASLNLVGVISILVILLTVAFMLLGKIKIKQHRLALLMLILAIVSIFSATSFSTTFWQILPVSFIQFPFRFLSVTLICVSFLAASIVFVLDKKYKVIVAIILLILTYFFSLSYLKVDQFQNYPDTFYSTNQDTTTVKNEYMPKWVKVIPSKMYKSKVEVLNGNENPEILVQNANKTSFNVSLEKSRTIQVNTVYFPGWVAYVNGVKKDIVYDNPNGLIRINLDKGENNVEVIFEETPVRLFSDFVSIISLSCLFISYYFLRKKTFKL